MIHVSHSIVINHPIKRIGEVIQEISCSSIRFPSTDFLKFLAVVCFPIAVAKWLMAILQGYTAARNLAGIDVAERAAEAEKQKQWLVLLFVEADSLWISSPLVAKALLLNIPNLLWRDFTCTFFVNFFFFIFFQIILRIAYRIWKCPWLTLHYSLVEIGRDKEGRHTR